MTTSPQVRPRRPYRSPRREQQAAQTRSVVLTAAAARFATHGWSATGMRDVAREAGVAVETVYANFGSKADLLMGAIDLAVVGDADPVPLADRPAFAALSEGVLEDRVAAAARLVTEIHQRTAGLHRALREAAASEPELAAKLREAENRRRVNTRQGAELVTGRSVSEEQATGLWAVLGVEVFHLLTEMSGWSHEDYEHWAARMLAVLLEEVDRP